MPKPATFTDDDYRAACEAILRTRLKAQVARIPLGLTGYWQVINSEEDPEFKKALEVVKNWKGDFPSGLK